MLVTDGADRLRKLGNLGLREPGRRLVEQDEARIGREGPRDTESPLVALRERVGPASACVVSPSVSSSSAARLLASRAGVPTPSAATSTFSCTDSDRKAWLCWNVLASPCLPRRLGLQRVDVTAPPA